MGSSDNSGILGLGLPRAAVTCADCAAASTPRRNPNTTLGAGGRPVILICGYNHEATGEALPPGEQPCQTYARYAVHLDGDGETFADELRCANHLEDAVHNAIGLSHGIGSVEVYLVAPRPDRAYPVVDHPHTGYERSL